MGRLGRCMLQTAGCRAPAACSQMIDCTAAKEGISDPDTCFSASDAQATAAVLLADMFGLGTLTLPADYARCAT